MKKIAIASVILPVVAWAGLTAYSGSQTEGLFHAGLEKVNQDLQKTSAGLPLKSPLQLELVQYDKHFLGSDAQLKLTLQDEKDQPLLVNLHLDHGPITWRPAAVEGTPAFALMTAQPTLDFSKLPQTLQDLLAKAFGGKAPLTGIISAQFDQSTQYRLALAPASYKDENSGILLNAEGATAEGRVREETRAGQTAFNTPMTLKAGKIRVELPSADSPTPNHLTFSGVDATVKALTTAEGMPLDTESVITIPHIEIESANLPEPISFGVNIKSTAAEKDGDIAGNYVMQFSDLKTPVMPASDVKMTANFAGFSLEALKKSQGQIQDFEKTAQEISQQIAQIESKALESTQPVTSETSTDNTDKTDTPATEPERPQYDAADQANIDALLAQSTANSNALIDTIVTEVLQPNKTHFQYIIDAGNAQGKTGLDIDLNYVGAVEGVDNINAETLQTLMPDQLLQLVRGKIDFSFDRDLFPMAALFLEHPAIQKEGNKYISHLELAGNKLVLNGEDMSIMEFMSMLQPPTGTGDENAEQTDGDGDEEAETGQETETSDAEAGKTEMNSTPEAAPQEESPATEVPSETKPTQ